MSLFDTYFDKIFVINLDSRPDRWKSMVEELERAGIKNYERFSAVRITDYKTIPPNLYQHCHFSPLAKNSKYHIGMVGCKLSHISVIRIAKSRGYNRILILEDDVIFLPNPGKILEKTISQVSKWDMLYLGATFLRANSFLEGKPNVAKVNGALTTSSYALDNSNGIFDFILKYLPVYGSEVDVFYAYNIHMEPQQLYAHERKYRITEEASYQTYMTLPFIARQGFSKSDIITEDQSNPYFGQYKQDKYCFENFLSHKTRGTFLDIGADDGVRFSNTFFFEKEKGYTGLCIEPRKAAFKKLITNRKCNCENIAVDVENREVEFQELFGYGCGLSGIIRNYDPRHVKRIIQEKKNPKHVKSEIIKVKTRKLQELLNQYNLYNIDFLSLDIEGGELDILKSIDWEKVRVNVITVENNYYDPEFRKYLESIGFIYKKRIACDEIYVNKDHLEFLKALPVEYAF